MLRDMTTLLANISAKRNAMDAPYIQIVEKNVVYALGKQLLISASGGGAEGSHHADVAVSDNH